MVVEGGSDPLFFSYLPGGSSEAFICPPPPPIRKAPPTNEKKVPRMKIFPYSNRPVFPGPAKSAPKSSQNPFKMVSKSITFFQPLPRHVLNDLKAILSHLTSQHSSNMACWTWASTGRKERSQHLRPLTDISKHLLRFVTHCLNLLTSFNFLCFLDVWCFALST